MAIAIGAKLNVEKNTKYVKTQNISLFTCSGESFCPDSHVFINGQSLLAICNWNKTDSKDQF